MSNRVAFTPLKSLETALDQAVQLRARTLFEQAKAKTARGSGHDLEKGVAGNGTAIASACLLLAKTESEGVSLEDFDAHQRHAMITKAQFKGLVATLQAVLELRPSAKNAFTPTRGSARKRKEAEVEDVDEPSTPSKTSRIMTTPNKHRMSTAPSETRRTSTRGSGKRSLETGAAVKDLLSRTTGKHAIEDPEEAADSLQVTPTKSAKTGKLAIDTSAFVAAVARKTPTKAAQKEQSQPQNRSSTTLMPAAVAVERVAEQTNDDGNAETLVPYETYWGDLLLRWRSKEEVDSRQRKTETWRQKMIAKVEI